MIQKIKFLVDELIACPSFLPMDEEDAIVTPSVFQANIMNPNIPLSELIRKEFYYNCYTSFSKAIQAEPALIKREI